MDLGHQMPWISWELFLMLCMLCMDKGGSFSLDIMIFCNYVVIMIKRMSLYVYMYVCHCLIGSS